MVDRRMTARPHLFRINNASPLYNGLVFAGLGQHIGGAYYHDDSAYKNSATMYGIVNTAASGWGFDTYLNRLALTFDGSGDYVYRAPTPFATTLPITVSGWFRFRLKPADSSYQYLYNFVPYSTYTHLLSAGYHSGGEIYYYTGASKLTTGFNVEAATWFHLVMLYESATSVKCWKNGAAVTIAQPTVFSVGGTQILLGAINNTNGFYFDGKMADVMVHTRNATADVLPNADPANVSICGLVRNIRRYWPTGYVAPAGGGFKPYWASRRTRHIGVGVA